MAHLVIRWYCFQVPQLLRVMESSSISSLPPVRYHSRASLRVAGLCGGARG